MLMSAALAGAQVASFVPAFSRLKLYSLFHDVLPLPAAIVLINKMNEINH